MLVKEIRQGMRGKVFVISFLFIQGLMILFVITGLIGEMSGRSASSTSGWYWFSLILPILIITPLRGLGAISSEIRANTLELIFLTKLSPLRIIFGKWLALMTQVALFVCSILPYAILRYFLGGINILDELLGLLLIVVGSATATALTICLSSFDSWVIRWLSLAGILILVSTVMGETISNSSLSKEESIWLGFIPLFIFLSLAVALFLIICAARIGPMVCDYAAHKRVLAIGLIGLMLVLALFQIELAVVLVCSGFLCAVVLCDLFIEHSHLIPSQVGRWLKRKSILRPWGMFVMPGWQSGLLFMLLLLILWMIHSLLSGWALSPYFHLGTFSFYAGLMLPAVILRAFFRMKGTILVPYVGIHAGLGIAGFILMLSLEGLGKWNEWVLLFTPWTMLIVSMYEQTDETSAWIQAGIMLIFSSILYVVLTYLSLPYWKELSALRKKLEQGAAETPAA